MTVGLASAVGWVYTLLLVALVVRAARQEYRPPLDEALLWMGLLCLGSLRSPLAPGIYTAIGALWLLTLLAARMHRSRDIVFMVLAFLIIPGSPARQRACRHCTRILGPASHARDRLPRRLASGRAGLALAQSSAPKRRAAIS